MASSLSSFRGQVNCFIVVHIDCFLTFAAFYLNFITTEVEEDTQEILHDTMK